MRNYILLFLCCVAFHILGTWGLPLIDRDETRFAEASREMRQRSDYVIPYFNNEYRFDKPPLTYWCQVVSFRAFGETDFAARFPTAVAATLVAIVLFAWGARLHGNQTGWWAAIIFTLSLQTFVHGKAAVADMWLVLFFTLSCRAGWELLRSTMFDWRWWSFFYVALAFGFLAKGPVGWIPLLAIVVAKRFFGTQKKLNARFRFLIGVLLMLAIVCVWAVPALIRTHGEFFRVGIMHHVVSRSLSPMEGHGASSPLMYLALLPFYFVTVFASFFPWSIRLPALWKNLRTKHDATDGFLLSGILIVFAIFTLAKTKLPHYTLPAFPLLALLLARRAEALQLSRPLAISVGSLYVAVALFGTSFLARFFPSYNLVRQSRLDFKPAMEFGAVDYVEPSLVWYSRAHVQGFMVPLRAKDAAAYMNRAGPRFVVLPTKLMSQMFPDRDREWRTYRTEGFNLAKGKRVDLTLLLKPR